MVDEAPRDKRKKPELRDLPEWPRLMSATHAGAYLGIHELTFLAEVGTVWPEPVRIGRRKLWDKLALDRAVETLVANQRAIETLAANQRAVEAKTKPAMDDVA